MKKIALTLNTLFLLLMALPSYGNPVEIVYWQENLKPGQKGYGLTVLQGDQPERFEVEFVSLIPHPFSPGNKAIAIRLGKPLKNTNIIEGMSGSPAYFKYQGKWRLIGALSFGHRLATGEPVVGVTPIQLMLNQKKIFSSDTAPELKPKTLGEENAVKAKPESKNSKLKPGDAIAIIFTQDDYV